MTKQNNPVLNHSIRGDGDAVILIHGLFGGLENLNMLAKSLEHQYKVINIDVRNHGKSFRHSSMSYVEMANDVFILLDQLNIHTCSIVGHSMGGKIAMQCALLQPERVTKLVIADMSPVKYGHNHTNVINGLQSIDLERVENRKHADSQLAEHVKDIGVRQFLLKSLYKVESNFMWRANIEVIANDYENISAAITSSAPFNGDTLFIKGGNSDYILTEHRPAIAKLFPKAKAKIINGTGHWLHAEKPEAFNKIVLSFLSVNKT